MKLLLCLLAICYICEARNKIVIVAMSGLRHDYVDLPGLSTLKRMKEDGFHAKMLNVSFITNSFPSLWTVVTGLWPEQHGILDNNMFDPELDAPFHGDVDSASSSWFKSEPIWITAERQGIRTAVSGWPGASLKVDGYRALHHAYIDRESVDNTIARISAFADWLADGADLGFFLFPEPDNAGHVNGTQGGHINQAMRINDGQLGQFMNALDQFGIREQTNVIVIGDHGLTNHHTDDVIYLSSFGVRLQHLSWMTGTLFTSGMLRPHDEYLNQVYHNLSDIPHMKVYKKEDIPERYHIKNNRRCAPLLLVPEKGYRVELIEPHALKTYAEKTVGMHGYDNDEPDMKSTMIAVGPDFQKKQVDYFDSKDIYPLVCSLLELNKCHGSPGSLRQAKTAVKDGSSLSDVRGSDVDYFKARKGYRKRLRNSSNAVSASVVLMMVSTLLQLF